MPDSDQPAGLASWLDSLAATEEVDHEKSLGRALRVIAGARQDAVCLCSGIRALPYVEWLRDGLRMSSRLIIHLDPEYSSLSDAMQNQADLDIRVAGHFQDLAGFIRDISHHRIDLLVADIDDTNRAVMHGLISLLSDGALLVAIADVAEQQQLRSDYATEFFVSSLGEQGSAIMMTRKGRQHRLSRRGGRQRNST